MLGVLLIVLNIAVVLVAAMLIGLILVQRSKGAGGLGGLAGNIGEESLGAGAGSAFRKATVALGIAFLVLVLAIPVTQAAAKRQQAGSVGDLPGATTEAQPPEPVPGGEIEPAPGTAELPAEVPADTDTAPAEDAE